MPAQTRLPLWLRKFNAWVEAQQPDDTGRIVIVTHQTTVGTPWSQELATKDQVRMTISYFPADRVFLVALEGRNIGDTEPVETVRGTFHADAWPATWSKSYSMTSLPPGAKLVINRHAMLGGYASRR